MGWSLTTHRCVRPSVSQVEELGAGIGSVWVCPTCHAAYRITEFDMSPVSGDYMQATVRWEVVRYGDIGKRRRLTST
ncbi:hypothetical protein GCM10029964_054300 [Kibdelosporangium lantanae]